MKDGLALAAPRPRRRLVKVAGLVALWLTIASVAWAAFSTFATGTVTVSTTSPNSMPLTLVGSLTFSNSGTSKPAVFSVTSPAGSQAYASYQTNSNSGVVASGPCAGFMTITSGNVGTWRDPSTGNPSPLVAGSTRRTDAVTNPITVVLSSSAPAACANQSIVPLDVTLELVP